MLIVANANTFTFYCDFCLAVISWLFQKPSYRRLRDPVHVTLITCCVFGVSPNGVSTNGVSLNGVSPNGVVQIG